MTDTNCVLFDKVVFMTLERHLPNEDLLSLICTCHAAKRRVEYLYRRITDRQLKRAIKMLGMGAEHLIKYVESPRRAFDTALSMDLGKLVPALYRDYYLVDHHQMDCKYRSIIGAELEQFFREKKLGKPGGQSIRDIEKFIRDCDEDTRDRYNVIKVNDITKHELIQLPDDVIPLYFKLHGVRRLLDYLRCVYKYKRAAWIESLQCTSRHMRHQPKKFLTNRWLACFKNDDIVTLAHYMGRIMTFDITSRPFTWEQQLILLGFLEPERPVLHLDKRVYQQYHWSFEDVCLCIETTILNQETLYLDFCYSLKRQGPYKPRHSDPMVRTISETELAIHHSIFMEAYHNPCPENLLSWKKSYLAGRWRISGRFVV